MPSAKQRSGPTHINYGHFRYPRLIQVVCPYCTGPALLTYATAPATVAFFMDITRYRLTWNFYCSNCLHKKSCTWNETKSMELLVQAVIRNECLQAWNSDHLDYLIRRLSGNKNTHHPWAFYKTYMHRRWQAKTKNRSDIVKLMDLYERTKPHKTI